MRNFARCAEISGGCTKTVSERLNSRAMDCIAAVSRPSGSSTTASGLPAKRLSVNTSSVTKRRRMGSSNRFGRKHPAWVDEFILRINEQNLARICLGGALEHAEDRRRGTRKRLHSRAGTQIVGGEQRPDRISRPPNRRRQHPGAQPE